MLIFGHFGAPALGLVGSAIASLCTTGLMALALGLFIALHPKIRRFFLFGHMRRPGPGRLAGKCFRIGTPIALTLAFEVAVFSAAVYLMGWIEHRECRRACDRAANRLDRLHGAVGHQPGDGIRVGLALRRAGPALDRRLRAGHRSPWRWPS